MRPSDRTSFVGVLGWPLEHTLSPVIHSAAFRALGLDWTYLAFRVRSDALREAVAGLRALGAMGANVTMPHKEKVIDCLDELSPDARAIGAVNTIQRIGRTLVGHNTDAEGFADFIANDAGIDVAEKTALVLGAGGAARAVVKAMDDAGASKIYVAARSGDKAADVAMLAGRAAAAFVEWPETGKVAEQADLVVNATPLGAAGEDALAGAAFRPGQAVVDLVYLPPTTPLVERARAGGASGWGGLGMLIHQAAASLRIWTGREPPLEALSAAAVRAIGGLKSHSDN